MLKLSWIIETYSTAARRWFGQVNKKLTLIFHWFRVLTGFTSQSIECDVQVVRGHSKAMITTLKSFVNNVQYSKIDNSRPQMYVAHLHKNLEGTNPFTDFSPRKSHAEMLPNFYMMESSPNVQSRLRSKLHSYLRSICSGRYCHLREFYESYIDCLCE